MSATATSTIEHTVGGPSRCLACGQFAGDGHSCPSRTGHQGVVRELYAVETTGRDRSESPPDLATARDELRQARIDVGLAALRSRRTHDPQHVATAIARRDAALDRVHRAELAATHTPPGGHRCPTCGQYADDTHTCPLPPGLPTADYADARGEARTKEMLTDLHTAVQAIVESGQLHRWLDAMASNGLNRWSLNNRLLAIMQLAGRGEPLDDAHMMGFRQWEGLNRHVRKGEKAIWILAPMTRKVRDVDDDGTITDKVFVTGFKSVPVFNVSQTDGAPLPEPPIRPATGEVSPGTLDGLRSRATAAGYAYEEKPIPGCDPTTGMGTLGYTDPKAKRIVVDARLSDAQKASTIAHELAHVHCGHVDGDHAEYLQHRGRMETEAEMTAYMVNRARGMSLASADAFSPGYIASWSRGDAAMVTGAMDKATKAFNKIMDGPWPT